MCDYNLMFNELGIFHEKIDDEYTYYYSLIDSNENTLFASISEITKSINISLKTNNDEVFSFYSEMLSEAVFIYDSEKKANGILFKFQAGISESSLYLNLFPNIKIKINYLK